MPDNPAPASLSVQARDWVSKMLLAMITVCLLELLRRHEVAGGSLREWATLFTFWFYAWGDWIPRLDDWVKSFRARALSAGPSE
jgi:hypothetical protein